MVAKLSLLPSQNEQQWSVNVFGSRIMHNPMAMRLSHPVIKVLATVISKDATDRFGSTT
jgi:hypothetical protein